MIWSTEPSWQQHTVSIWPSSHLVSLVTLTVKAKASHTPGRQKSHFWDTTKQGCARHSLSQELLCSQQPWDSNSSEAAKVLCAIFTTPDLPGFVWSQIPVNPSVCLSLKVCSRVGVGCPASQAGKWLCASRSLYPPSSQTRNAHVNGSLI